MWVTQPQCCEQGRLSPLLIWFMVAWVEERCPLPPLHQHLGQVEGLSLQLTSLLAAALGSFGSCTSPGQHSGADPDAVGVPTLRAWRLENWPHSSLIAARGDSWTPPPQAVLERAHLGGKDWGELVGWWTLQLPRSRTRVMTWPAPIYTPFVICWSTWRGLIRRPKAAGSPQHYRIAKKTTVRAQHL